jgi:cytochrome c heme-lyase
MGSSSSKHHHDQPKKVEDLPSPETKSSPSSNERQELESSSISQEESSKCPMHRSDGSYSYDWRKLFQAAAVHGPSGQKPLSKEEQKDVLVSKSYNNTGSECPIQRDISPPVPGCPSSSSYPEYNVYSQPIIDQTNQMPHGAKTQLPNPLQTKELATDRVSSTIPKGGQTSSTWTYPSPQQFYNALSRKGKLNQKAAGEEASEEDMASVVALHNNMNEKTWAKVVEWEHQTYDDHATPKLLKFMGRPHDLSPKARFKHYVLGHPLPFDRHDWTIVRKDGTTVRYVIDYYYDDSRAQETEKSAMPDLHDRDGTPSLLVDVRPALDGPQQWYARAIQMPYKILTGQTNYQPLPLKGTPEMSQQVQESIQVWKSIQLSQKRQQNDEVVLVVEEHERNKDSVGRNDGIVEITEEQAREIANKFAMAIGDCQKAKQRMEKCTDEEECARASMDLTMCMGERLCPVQHASLVKVLATTQDSNNEDGKIEASLETLTECVVWKTAQRRLAREQHPTLFQK